MWMLKRATDVLKDAGSLCMANLTPQSSSWNPDIETSVINATNHDDTCIDYESAQRIYAWINVSSHYIRPILRSLSSRMDKTHNSTVVLKGLMLLHGIFTCKVPRVQKIGRLPFDLSNFKDRDPDMCHYEAFIRAYYTFLDKKSSFMFQEDQREGSLRKGIKEKPKQSSLMQDLVLLGNLQGLLGLLLETKPQPEMMTNVLVLEAMDCIVIETFDIYSRICNGIASVLVRLYSMHKTEAELVFSVMQKASVQAKVLNEYVEFCKDFGVAKASESPKIVYIGDEDIRSLEQLVKKVSYHCKTQPSSPKEEDKSMILVEDNNDTIKKTDSLQNGVT